MGTTEGGSVRGKAVRETVAAVGVIASLVFVGWEIRQSNAQARAAAYQAIGVATAEAIDSWAHDPILSNAQFKPAAAMDSTEWRQYINKFTVFARLGEMVLLQIEEGVLDEDALARLGYGGWRTIFDDPKVGCIWPWIRAGVSDSFRTFVEKGQNPNALDCSGYALPGPPPTNR